MMTEGRTFSTSFSVFAVVSHMCVTFLFGIQWGAGDSYYSKGVFVDG
jgi:hypothetical protein